MARDLLDAVYGCLVAGAIGDALGAPAERLYYQEVRAKYGKLTDFVAHDNSSLSSGAPGAVTDDTTLRHLMCLAIVRKGGRITPEDAAEAWLGGLNPDRFWSPDRIALMKLKAGVDPWDAGRGSIPSACPVMAMPPIGLINAGNPAQAYQDGCSIAAINGDDVNRHAAATLAAGVAAAVVPGATVDDAIDAMTRHSSWLVRRAIELTMDLARATEDVDAFTERFYDRLLDWWSRPGHQWRKDHFTMGTGIETVPLAMAILYLCRGDVNRCLVEAASFGRDADSLAFVAGSLAGALQGAGAVRPDWVAACETANEPLFEEMEGDGSANFRSMAERMVGALKQEAEATRRRAAFLDGLLGP